MARFQNPGAFFLGTLVASEQKFLKPLIENARKQGYNRFIEPCAGAFAMAHLAVQAGWKPGEIETSDVAMFSSIMGYAITGQSLEPFELKARGFSDEDLLDPVVALYAQLYLRTAKQAGQAYFHELLRDLEYRREHHLGEMRKQMQRAHDALHGMSYRAIDMWDHLEECYDDPHALVIANPPTYTAGFEKWYDTGGNMTWKEPPYKIFDPNTGLKELMDRCKDAKCLIICYEENEPGKTAGDPIFSRYGVRTGVNVYLTTNRSDEATALANGKKIDRANESNLTPLNCSILPRDYVITEKSEVQVMRIESKEAQYYRKLWTHNFVGSSAPINMAVLIDGMMAGVFGLDKAALIMGAFGSRVSDAVFIMYGMAVAHETYRLNRLLTMLAQNRPFIDSICDDIERVKAKTLKTVQMTKYPEAKEMRGLMKLVTRVKDKKHGYKLTYMSQFFDRNEQETLTEWLRREKRWAEQRAKTKSDMRK